MSCSLTGRTPGFDPDGRGSNPRDSNRHTHVAQSVEPAAVNRRGGGSNPSVGAVKVGGGVIAGGRAWWSDESHTLV